MTHVEATNATFTVSKGLGIELGRCHIYSWNLKIGPQWWDDCKYIYLHQSNDLHLGVIFQSTRERNLPF